MKDVLAHLAMWDSRAVTLLFQAERGSKLQLPQSHAPDWADVNASDYASQKDRPLERVFQPPGFTPYGPPPKRIPLFAVGYTGWRQLETVKQRACSGVVDGILIIDSGLFSTRDDFPNGQFAQGPLALWGLITALHYCTLSIALNSFSPIEYVRRYAT